MVDDEVQKLLGGDVDVTVLTGKLLADALKGVVQTGPDWKEFKARHKQAMHDAALMKLAVESERQGNKVLMIATSPVCTLRSLCIVPKAAVESLKQQIQAGQSQIQLLEKTIQSTKIESEMQKETALKEAQDKVHLRQG